MRQDSGQHDSAVVIASSPVAGAGAGTGETTVALPRFSPLGRRVALPRPRLVLSPVAGKIALASMIVGALAVLLFAAAGPSALVPRSDNVFPGWEAGPLHWVLSGLRVRDQAVSLGLSAVIVAMGFAYLIVLSTARMLSMRLIAACVVALHLILLLAPPLQLTDVFNYLGYARLGALHGLNPYTHVINAEVHDPIFRLATWHNLRSPYGPLFTALSYPVALLPLPVAYWVLKSLTVLLSLGFIALVAMCARQLRRDPRFVVAFVALNPVYLVYAIGGFHNDFLMLVPSTAAVLLLLARRDRAAGAVLMLAVAVKFTAILLLPFLLIAVPDSRRRLRICAGAALGAIPLVAMSLALFGFSLPNLQDQSTLLTDFSIPNLMGVAVGVGGGTATLIRAASVALVLTVVFLLRRRGDWISGAGWATLALVASLAWLVPWYVIWVLPLAALGSSVRLRRATLAMSAFLVIAFIPATGLFLAAHNINPMGGSAGQASWALQQKLAGQ
jgi:hypothetical protein